MSTDSVFHWARIAAPGKNFVRIAQELDDQTLPALEAAGGRRWALANGLFGLWNHEVILVTSWDVGSIGAELLASNLPVGASVVDSYEFLATARPSDDQPLSKPGIYVHRLFGVDAANIDRFVSLSDEAWKTFETATSYESQPHGPVPSARAPCDGRPDVAGHLVRPARVLGAFADARAGSSRELP